MRTATEIEALRIAAEILHPLELMKGEAERLDDAGSVKDFCARQCRLIHLGADIYVRPLSAQAQLRGRWPIADDQPCLINSLGRF